MPVAADTAPQTLKKSPGSSWQSTRTARRRFSFRTLLWMMIFPQRGQKTGLTASGLLLIVLALAIGMAAYNSASNILFLTLSLLLGCLILSGVLSWLNFSRLRWRLDLQPPFRAGQEHSAGLCVRNEKRVLPSYGVWFDLEVESASQPIEVPLRGRLDPRGETRLEWSFVPAKRGVDRVKLNAVGSLFPFGFLRKAFSVELEEKFLVWPAAVTYRIARASALQRLSSGESLRRAGQSGDLLSLRRYQLDDSHRQIHWKASARLRQLMVRQTAAEAGDSVSLWVEISAELWPRPEQFELLCSLAASLASDLFAQGKLRAAGVGEQPMFPVRRLIELERFFDALALAKPTNPKIFVSPQPNNFGGPRPMHRMHRKNLVTFAPDGARGVCAYLDGERAATA
ncbi:MAG TPA: DUF58 domain-containing protein [Opitutaceae bacterium]|nr:DUF58 domain-containing protein [Opitutaceae bacterium]